MKRTLKTLFLIINFWIVFLLSKLLACGSFLFKKAFKKFKKEKSIVYLDLFPHKQAAGHKYRVTEWMKLFNTKGYKTCVYTIEKNHIIYFDLLKPENISYFFVISIWKRFAQILMTYQYETVIVRRELLQFNDYGDLFMEKLLLSIHPNVILDFDDDLAEAKNEPRNITSLFGKLMLENGSKFSKSLTLYSRFIVASNYLKNYVLSKNTNITSEAVLVIPTCVEYNDYPAKKYDYKKEKITLGWIGGDPNLVFLESIIPAINMVSKKYSLELLVISGKEFKPNTNIPVINLPWSFDNEVEYLKMIDIGLMPLPLNDRTKGKGGFKLIQYMGLGIVSVGSAVTINEDIIDDGVNGYLVSVTGKWEDVLEKVINEKENFSKIGEKAREKIQHSYSFKVNFPKYLSFIESKFNS